VHPKLAVNLCVKQRLISPLSHPFDLQVARLECKWLNELKGLYISHISPTPRVNRDTFKAESFQIMEIEDTTSDQRVVCEEWMKRSRRLIRMTRL
jgi:hypothetical protein